MANDIVKRLLKVAAVSEIIKDNPKIYYDAAHEIARLRERLAEADEANRRVSDENEKLRRALHDIYEVYAGIDGYLFDESKAYREQKFKAMADIAAEHKKTA